MEALLIYFILIYMFDLFLNCLYWWYRTVSVMWLWLFCFAVCDGCYQMMMFYRMMIPYRNVLRLILKILLILICVICVLFPKKHLQCNHILIHLQLEFYVTVKDVSKLIMSEIHIQPLWFTVLFVNKSYQPCAVESFFGSLCERSGVFPLE